MNIDQFLSLIESHSSPDDWVVDQYGHLRSTDTVPLGSCPICWLGTKLDKNPSGWRLAWDSPASHMGLKYEHGQRIVAAADRAEHMEPELRERLLKACRVTSG